MKSNVVTKALLTLVFILVGFFSQVAFAQTCNCTYTIEPSVVYVDGSKLNLAPGSTVCIKAGIKKYLKLVNFQGSATNYIKFVNCGGQVVINATTGGYGISIDNSKYFRFTGTGDAAFKYGIKVAAAPANASGLAIGAKSTDFEIDHMEIANVGFAGILSKTDPKCDGSTNKGTFTQRNTSYHDNYIHDTHGEGMYIGSSFYNGHTYTCNTVATILYPHEIHGLRVYNNITDKTGWDGIQVGCATTDVEIYGNKVTNYGLGAVDGQMAGIQINPGTSGKCYSNFIKDGKGTGIFLTGIGNNLVYNNVVINSGKDYFPLDATKKSFGIFSDDRKPIAGSYVHLVNNTIINPKTEGIRFLNKITLNNKIANNIVVRPGTTAATSYIYTIVGASVQATNNYTTTDINAVKFANIVADDYKLMTGSPAIDKGMDVATLNITKDFAYQLRKVGTFADAGAYEMQTTVAAAREEDTNEAKSTSGVVESAAHKMSANTISVNVYPNPAQETLYINVDAAQSGKVTYGIKDAIGRTVMTSQAEGGEKFTGSIDVSSLPSGLYFINVSVNGKTMAKRFQKN